VRQWLDFFQSSSNSTYRQHNATKIWNVIYCRIRKLILYDAVEHQPCTLSPNCRHGGIGGLLGCCDSSFHVAGLISGGGYGLPKFKSLVTEDHELQDKNGQLQPADRHKAMVKFNDFLIVRRFCFAVVSGLFGLYLSVLGWQYFDNERRLLGIVLIGGGWMVGSLGLLLLWLTSFPFSWGWLL
jgi:hypothetical protein